MMHPQHDDPVDEARQKAMQFFGVVSTLSEAVARFAAVGIQRKAAEEERAAGRERAAEAASREADRLGDSVRADRERLARRVDGSWLKDATLTEVAQLWRTATVHAAAGDPVAQKLAGLALDRLGELHPQWRAAYDRQRAAGKSAPDAARAAAHEVWESESTRAGASGRPARPHGGPEAPKLRAGANGKALPAGGQALNDLDAAVRAEAVRLIADVSPEALDRLQRDLRASGRAPAADSLGLARQYVSQARKAGALTPVVANAIDRDLLARADEDPAQARTVAGTPDHPRTAVDEHTERHVVATGHYGSASHDQAVAQQRRLGSTFAPLVVGAKVDPLVAAKRPATVVSKRVRAVTR
ncbi:hypothetical protein GA0070610_1807 [Micromonospora echinofusca]|uniref:Uncharacterized protein n=2 Tax=Micromonospora echinofusca TaxID=47858 RepID=A0A1C5G7M7_MICEH|nr:hypothetical protein GA0070610_1807 [Micromonospora echinofusca]